LHVHCDRPCGGRLCRFGTDCGAAVFGPHCIAQREKVFDSYMADKSRSWIKQPAAPEAHASGVRLFAMSKRRKEMSCEELQHSKREADSAPGALRGPGGKNLTPAQVSRGVMLAGDVGRELAKEISKRCSRT